MEASYAASTHNVPNVVTHVASGRFRTPDQLDVLLARESHLELLGSTPAVPSGHLGLAHESLFIQPIHGAIRDMAVMPSKVCSLHHLVTVHHRGIVAGIVYPQTRYHHRHPMAFIVLH